MVIIEEEFDEDSLLESKLLKEKKVKKDVSIRKSGFTSVSKDIAYNLVFVDLEFFDFQNEFIYLCFFLRLFKIIFS